MESNKYNRILEKKSRVELPVWEIKRNPMYDVIKHKVAYYETKLQQWHLDVTG